MQNMEAAAYRSHVKWSNSYVRLYFHFPIGLNSFSVTHSDSFKEQSRTALNKSKA
jgi:hypothetical protein